MAVGGLRAGCGGGGMILGTSGDGGDGNEGEDGGGL